jgi:hypothetical protein
MSFRSPSECSLAGPTDTVSPVNGRWHAASPPPGRQAPERAAHVFPLVADWAFSASMAELLAAFGERLPGRGLAGCAGAGSLPELLHLGEELPGWLGPVAAGEATGVKGLSDTRMDILRRTLAIEGMASGHFNFRTPDGEEYRERSQAAAADFPPKLRDRVFELTDQLGLVTPTPPRFDRYDTTLVLGGGHLFPLLRARYAAQLRAAGTGLGELRFLGSPRFLIEEPPERPFAATFAPNAADEVDLMVGAARTEFGLRPASEVFLCGCSSAEAPCPHWALRHAEQAKDTPAAFTHERRIDLMDETGRIMAMVLSPSTSRPPHRPNTWDTFSLWARCADPRSARRVLAVTSQVFVPFQTFEGLRCLYLRRGVDLNVVGHSADWGYPPLTAEYLLQETLSAVRSARRLLVDAAEILMGAQSDA